MSVPRSRMIPSVRLRAPARAAVAVAVVGSLVGAPQPAVAAEERDLRTDPAEFVAYGSKKDDRLGLSLAMGDLNGDGIADIAAGAPLDEKPDDTEFNRGALHVYFGQPGLSGERDAAQPGSPDLIIYGERGGDRDGTANRRADVLGKGVAIGDVNRDGRNDLVVSALRANVEVPEFRARAGKVYVFYQPQGGSWPSVIDLSQDPGLADVTILGDRAGGEFGIHLAVADFDGDGFADVLGGAPSVLDARRPGALRVVYGSGSLPETIDLKSPPPGVRTLNVEGEEAGDKLGHGVAAGDLNFDGLPDMVAGAPKGGGECTNLTGGFSYAVVFYGSASSPPTGTWNLATQPAPFTIRSGQADDQMARRMGVGDVTGDGKQDLVLGARCADGMGRADAGAGYVLFGPLPTGSRNLGAQPPDLTVIGAQAGHQLGVGPGAGDVTGDGTAEVLLGADGVDGPDGSRPDAGAMMVVHGPVGTGTRDLASAPADLTIHSPDAFDRLGRFVDTGDVDGDGVRDLGVSAYMADGFQNATGNDAGEVHVLTGLGGDTPPPPPPPPTECTITGTPGDDSLRGTAGDDVICGLEGNDSIQGMGGNDVIFAGPGDDRADGGDGDDTVQGEDGADALKGAAGTDVLDGGDGDDRLDGVDQVSGNDSLDGGAGRDRCQADPGDAIVACE